MNRFLELDDLTDLYVLATSSFKPETMQQELKEKMQ